MQSSLLSPENQSICIAEALLSQDPTYGAFSTASRGKAGSHMKDYKIHGNLVGNHLPFREPLGQGGVTIIWNL